MAPHLLFLTPRTITISAGAAHPVIVDYSSLSCAWLMVSVRTLSTATYCALGNRLGQEDRLTAVGDSRVFESSLGAFNACDLYASVDAGYAILEISGMEYISEDAAIAEPVDIQLAEVATRRRAMCLVPWVKVMCR